MLKVSVSDHSLHAPVAVRSRKPSGAGLELSHSEPSLHEVSISQHALDEMQRRKRAKTRSKDAAKYKSHVRTSSAPVSRATYFLYYARLFCFFILSIGIINVGLLMYPFLTLLKPYYWRKFSDQLEAMWVNACLWLFPNTYLVQHGDFPDASTKPKLIICNHATEVDWYYLWMVARLCKVDRTGQVKILLKKEVSKIPVFGWGCRLFSFIFLRRNWKQDEKTMDTAIKRLVDDGEPLWIFLFPEGTTMNTRCREKSKAFARASDHPRPDLNLTILPRARGFQAVLEMLKKYSAEEPEVFDMTMSFDSYTGEVPTWEMGYRRNRDVLIPNHSTLVMGKCSSRCHLDSRRFTYDEITSHADGIEGWLDERWLRKDRLLEKFTHKQGFDIEECGPGQVKLVEGSLWKSILVVSANAAMWVYLGLVIQTENVSFLELLPRYI